MEQIALSLSHRGFEEGTHREEGKGDETWVHLVEGVDMVSNVQPCIWQHCLWTWSPTNNLASSKTVCEPLFVIFISHASS
jgi:hypothetical protein